MFGIGAAEILALLLVAVLYLGAKRLPEAGSSLGDIDVSAGTDHGGEAGAEPGNGGIADGFEPH